MGHGIFEYSDASKEVAELLPERETTHNFETRAAALAFRHAMCFFGTSRVAIRKRVLERVLPIPGALTIEADEFMSTLAVALAGGLALDRALAYYRLHDGNLYQFAKPDDGKTRRKYEALSALTRELEKRLVAAGISAEAARAAVEPTEIDARRLKLILDGGTPWETFQVERADLRLGYREMPLAYRGYKWLTLGLALVIPPRQFYSWRRRYAASGLHRWRKILGEPVAAGEIHRHTAEPQTN